LPLLVDGVTRRTPRSPAHPVRRALMPPDTEPKGRYPLRGRFPILRVTWQASLCQSSRTVLTKLTPIKREVKSESGTWKQSAGTSCRAWRAVRECCSAGPQHALKRSPGPVNAGPDQVWCSADGSIGNMRRRSSSALASALRAWSSSGDWSGLRHRADDGECPPALRLIATLLRLDGDHHFIVPQEPKGPRRIILGERSGTCVTQMARLHPSGELGNSRLDIGLRRQSWET